ncbi:c-type heme family protein [Rubinisphaera italica]|uniref:Tll0287-like domain-containing protein n=1 Tax=Rubinisphaera italica TaxID=2527969 RepID=A0A5C5XLE8_9PLAN|nr:DUF3365 domain-containing protein [Rubinisphaera italica]TWT63369.1 hypothetical protein Pan54_41220 [Rubinisphaera italica]
MKLKLRHSQTSTVILFGLLIGTYSFSGFSVQTPIQAEDKTETTVKPEIDNENLPATIAEARGRAKLLHETIHGTLHIIHRDFFDDESGQKIPSHSLEEVFEELAASYDVQVNWLAVNARAMNLDNEAKTEFEHKAVKVLSAGKDRFEEYSDETYKYAGAIRLPSQCLKCHVPARNNNKERAAGLVIIMPLKK